MKVLVACEESQTVCKALRYCADRNNHKGCRKCPINADGMVCGAHEYAMRIAADALEAADKKIAKLEKSYEWKAYAALEESIEGYKTRIAELEAQLPKEGEWKWDKDGMDFNIGSWICSRCQERPNTYWQGEENINPLRFSGSRYCPNCGAKMKGANDE